MNRLQTCSTFFRETKKTSPAFKFIGRKDLVPQSLQFRVLWRLFLQGTEHPRRQKGNRIKTVLRWVSNRLISRILQHETPDPFQVFHLAEIENFRRPASDAIG